MEKTLNELENQLDEIKHGLTSGRASDFADYRRMCGKIEGIQLAMTIIRENTNDEDD